MDLGFRTFEKKSFEGKRKIFDLGFKRGKKKRKLNFSIIYE
jgi:hypothetical protein